MRSKVNKLTVNDLSLLSVALIPPHPTPVGWGGKKYVGQNLKLRKFRRVNYILARFASFRPKYCPWVSEDAPFPYFPPFVLIVMVFFLLYIFMILYTTLALRVGVGRHGSHLFAGVFSLKLNKNLFVILTNRSTNTSQTSTNLGKNSNNR